MLVRAGYTSYNVQCQQIQTGENHKQKISLNDLSAWIPNNVQCASYFIPSIFPSAFLWALINDYITPYYWGNNDTGQCPTNIVKNGRMLPKLSHDMTVLQWSGYTGLSQLSSIKYLSNAFTCHNKLSLVACDTYLTPSQIFWRY